MQHSMPNSGLSGRTSMAYWDCSGLSHKHWDSPRGLILLRKVDSQRNSLGAGVSAEFPLACYQKPVLDK